MKNFKVKTLMEILNAKLAYDKLAYKFIDIVPIDNDSEYTLCLVSNCDELDMVAIHTTQCEDELIDILWNLLGRIDDLIDLLHIYDQFASNQLRIDLNNLSGTCVKQQYYKKCYNVTITDIRSDEHGFNITVTHQFPYRIQDGTLETCHADIPYSEIKEFSSSTVMVDANNFRAVIRLLTHQVNKEFKSSEFNKQLQK